ncbi:unnamed protein product [Lactuca virosa]|uniref:Uncharacterized protein n=1 Tax=Lactuca virosa TaxID=75947 RepID=A0AAU9NCC9_9ASTR|nr:unnamed protein product [Lactuca virosa]
MLPEAFWINRKYLSPVTGNRTCWHNLTRLYDYQAPTRNFGHTVLTIRAEVITNAIKLLDESLLAIRWI